MERLPLRSGVVFDMNEEAESLGISLALAMPNRTPTGKRWPAEECRREYSGGYGPWALSKLRGSERRLGSLLTWRARLCVDGIDGGVPAVDQDDPSG
jgi:hypothetical protein